MTPTMEPCPECNTAHVARCSTHGLHRTACRPRPAKPEPGETKLNYGTRTLPRRFWTPLYREGRRAVYR